MRRRLPRLQFIHTALAGRPRLLTGVIVALAVVVFFAAGWAAWFSYDLTAGLPDRSRPSRHRRHGAGDDDLRRRRHSGLHDFQGTAHRRAAREDLAEPDQGGDLGRGPALLRARRRRRHPGRSRPLVKNFADRPPLGRRQHHHPAARPSELPQPRQDLPPQAEGSDPRRLHREDVQQARDPRALPEQGLFRRRPLRRRGGVARLFRQVGVGSDGGRGRAARRPDQVPLELRADGQPGARGRAPERGAADDGRVGRDRPADRRTREARAGQAARTRSRSRRPSGCTSRSRSAASWSSVSAGSASTRAACASTPPSTPTCSRAPSSCSKKALVEIEKRPAIRTRRAPSSRRRRTESSLRTCRARSSRWTRRPATSGRWSAAATSTRAISTAPSRPSGRPGSAFKPFVYAAALEAGYSPASVISNLNDPIATPQGGWIPEDEHSTVELDDAADRA